MNELLPGESLCMSSCVRKFMRAFLLAIPFPTVLVSAQNPSLAPSHSYFVDCSARSAGDGSAAAPWNSLAAAAARAFVAGDRIALARGTVCHGSFAPKGSGAAGNIIRLTAYGQGARPRIVASAKDRQALLLFNQEYWQVDSLDLSGASKYGIFVSGDKGTMHDIALKNLYVHEVRGGEMKNKDNGLVVVGPSSKDALFTHVLVDGVTAAHTNQWAGILIGGGNYAWAADAPLNSHVTVRNSSVQDVYGDGIILFRDSDGLIETSTAWETGMQPTETTGTPNAIWTWTCTDCTVRDNEAFLTDSPGVDGGAYDIDWDNTRNVVERNYAHDTQGYCVAVFAAGYVTSESVVRDNLCIDNGLSPRLAALQGAVYLHTWNDGVIRGLRMERNRFVWNPPVAGAAAIVSDAGTGGTAFVFALNTVESSSPLIYRTNAQFAPSRNSYRIVGADAARFSVGDRQDLTLAELQAAGIENGSTAGRGAAHALSATPLGLDATVDFVLDADGLLTPGPRAQLMVLRSLAMQYGDALRVTVHLQAVGNESTEKQMSNALLDLDAGSIRFERDGGAAGGLGLLTADGKLISEWHRFQNAATLGGAVRELLGAPRFGAMRDKY